jgi:hypothetical protein
LFKTEFLSSFSYFHPICSQTKKKEKTSDIVGSTFPTSNRNSAASACVSTGMHIIEQGSYNLNTVYRITQYNMIVNYDRSSLLSRVRFE